MTTIAVEIKKNIISAKEKARLDYYKKLADRLVKDFKPITLRELDEIRCSPSHDLAPFGETFLATRLEELMGERYTPGAQNVILNHVKASTYCSIRDLNAPYNIIPVKNGNVDVLTGKLYAFDFGEWQFLQRFENITYDPKARTPKNFIRVLKEIQPDPDVRYWRVLRPFSLIFDRTLIKRQCEIWMGDGGDWAPAPAIAASSRSSP